MAFRVDLTHFHYLCSRSIEGPRIQPIQVPDQADCADDGENKMSVFEILWRMAEST
ncbi:hypothetical protein BofuT4_uP131510.1 [Botrytis cinerea T4]|uniref:Uncharacterized protein n=1 Tax=Botryotinia fuckeliana (strain T4) TaxID=999810 RepID=G2YQS3_BOTF4|nr:hypothetical protein BofuT4_uP131510.1 [Botrytis cinerea T4]